jgi:hypothetical protein
MLMGPSRCAPCWKGFRPQSDPSSSSPLASAGDSSDSGSSSRRRREDAAHAGAVAGAQAPGSRRRSHRGNWGPYSLGFASTSSSPPHYGAASRSATATGTNGACPSGAPAEFGGSGSTRVLPILLFGGGGSFAFGVFRLCPSRCGVCPLGFTGLCFLIYSR